MRFDAIRRPFEPVIRRVLHGYWRFSRGLTLGVRALVFDGEGRVFLVKHSYVAGWHLPGGGVETGETLISALERELREEGNIELTEPPVFHAVYFNRRVSQPRPRRALYRACIPADRAAAAQWRDRRPRILRDRRVAERYVARDARAHRRSAHRPRRVGTVVNIQSVRRQCGASELLIDLNIAALQPLPWADVAPARWAIGSYGEMSMRKITMITAAALVMGVTGAVAAPMHGGALGGRGGGATGGMARGGMMAVPQTSLGGNTGPAMLPSRIISRATVLLRPQHQTTGAARTTPICDATTITAAAIGMAAVIGAVASTLSSRAMMIPMTTAMCTPAITATSRAGCRPLTACSGATSGFATDA